MFRTSTLDGVGGQRHAPAALPPRKTQLGGPQSRSGRMRNISLPPSRDSIPGTSSPYQVAIPTELSRPTMCKVGKVRKFSAQQGFDPRNVQPRSKSLYQLSYPGPPIIKVRKARCFLLTTTRTCISDALFSFLRELSLAKWSRCC
jgi:hypothetical protein